MFTKRLVPSEWSDKEGLAPSERSDKEGLVPSEHSESKGLVPKIISRAKLEEKSRGFTLIELLVVIAIIGILAGIIIVNVNSARIKSRDARRKADLESIRSAIEMYADANGNYPPTTPNPIKSYTDVTSWTVAIFQVSSYISVIPKDPLNTAVRQYGYGTANSNSEFKLCANLEADTKSEENDGGNSADRYEIGNNLSISACP